MTAPASWVVMPVIDCLDYTLQAVEDVLAQDRLSAPPRVLIIDNGSSRETRRALEALQLHTKNRVLCWFHNPPLGPPPSGTVNASWNAGLKFCWAQGAERAFVLNNDLRLHPTTLACLETVMLEKGAAFVSAVGVTEEDFTNTMHPERGEGVYDPAVWMQLCADNTIRKGGPDFSCFLISRDCHEAFPFDPQFHYFGDNDYHRQLILAGAGEAIFSINVPYLHYGSQTIKRTPEAEAGYHAIFEAQRERYLAKWGGMPGEETWDQPHVGPNVVLLDARATSGEEVRA